MKSKEASRVIQGVIDGSNLSSREKEYFADLLKRDTPKKPIHKMVCPACEESIVDDSYCANCGQKIDWSDLE